MELYYKRNNKRKKLIALGTLLALTNSISLIAGYKAHRFLEKEKIQKPPITYKFEPSERECPLSYIRELKKSIINNGPITLLEEIARCQVREAKKLKNKGIYLDAFVVFLSKSGFERGLIDLGNALIEISIPKKHLYSENPEFYVSIYEDGFKKYYSVSGTKRNDWCLYGKKDIKAHYNENYVLQTSYEVAKCGKFWKTW